MELISFLFFQCKIAFYMNIYHVISNISLTIYLLLHLWDYIFQIWSMGFCICSGGGGGALQMTQSWLNIYVKSVQSALSDLKRPLNVYSPSAIIGLSLLNSILMARFLKQSFAQTCLKETDNGKLHQFNYWNESTLRTWAGKRVMRRRCSS